MKVARALVLFVCSILVSTVMVSGETSGPGPLSDGQREWISDPLVKDLIQKVTDNVTEGFMYGVIENLTSFGTRYAHADNNSLAVDWIHGQLAENGYEMERHVFIHQGNDNLTNIIAKHPGTGSDGVLIVCAHLDSTNWPESYNFPNTDAPGADDDATGIAVVLAAAKALSRYNFKYEIRFIGFNAEELTRAVGSTHYTENLTDRNENIRGVLNLDMLGYNDNYIYQEVIYDVPSHAMFTESVDPVNKEFGFITVLNAKEDPGSPTSWGDIDPFWEQGYKGLTFTESAHPKSDGQYYRANTNYHSENDTIDTLNMDLVTRVGRLVVGSIVMLAEPTLPDLVLEDLVVSDGTFFENETIDVNLTIENIGNFGASDVTVVLKVDGVQHASENVSVGVSEDIDLSFNWSGDAGEHVFEVTVDPFDAIGEWDEGNNYGSISKTIIAKPDIDLLEFDVMEDNITERGTAHISVKGFNHGPSEIECTFVLTDDLHPSETYLTEFVHLGPMETWETVYDWTSHVNGTHRLKGAFVDCMPGDRNGTNNVMSDQIEVNGRPVARLLVNPNIGGLTYQSIMFSAEASSDDEGVELFKFDFGDGNESGWTALPVVYHNYTDDGTYIGALVTMDAHGSESRATSQKVTIMNRPPVAKIASDRLVNGKVVAETDTPITFYSNDSYDRDGHIVSYNWTFTLGSVSSTKQSPKVAFSEKGEGMATLIIRDDDGDTSYTSIIISITNRPPVAVMVGPREAEVGQVLQFMGSDSYDQDGTGLIKNHFWDFGDGTTSREANPTHVYRSSDNFTVVLKVEDMDGGIDITTMMVSISERPVKVDTELGVADYVVLGTFVIILVVMATVSSVLGPARPPKKGASKGHGRLRGS